MDRIGQADKLLSYKVHLSGRRTENEQRHEAKILVDTLLVPTYASLVGELQAGRPSATEKVPLRLVRPDAWRHSQCDFVSFLQLFRYSIKMEIWNKMMSSRRLLL